MKGGDIWLLDGTDADALGVDVVGIDDAGSVDVAFAADVGAYAALVTGCSSC